MGPSFMAPLAVLALTTIPATSVGSQDWRDEDPRFSPEAEKKVEEIREAVDREVATLDATHWAGRYYYGDGRGLNVYLAIAPKSGFAFESHGCLGLWGRNYGSIQEKGGSVTLSYELANGGGSDTTFSDDLNVIRWGKRRYLVASADLINFCNKVNSKSEPRDEADGSVLLKRGDWKHRVTGLPQVPTKYRSYLLKTPIDGKITSVTLPEPTEDDEESFWREIPATLNVGEKDGVLPGMKFHVTESSDDLHGVFMYVTIEGVEEHSSKAIIAQHSCDGEEPPPEVGWTVSTLPSSRRDEGDPPGGGE